MLARVLFVVALLVAVPARGDNAKVGFVDMNKVFNTSRAGQQIGETLRAAAAPQVRELEEAKKAKAKPERLAELQAKLNSDQDQRAQLEMGRLRARVSATLSRLPAVKKLDEVLEGAPLFTRNDLTEQVIKALDDADELQRQNAELKAENEKLRAAKKVPVPSS